MASEVKFDLSFKTSNLDYPGTHMHIASNNHVVLWGSGNHKIASS